MEFNNMGNILTISFGIITFITTLVGLSAIFLSLNMQQNIQKLRDIYWEIILLEFTNIENERNFVKLFSLYKQMYLNDNKLTKTILRIVLFSLSIVIIILNMVLYFIKPVSRSLEFNIAISLVTIGSSILILFMYIFRMLNDTRKSSELPTPKDLLDGYPKKDINTLLIAGNFMKLKVIRWQHRDAFQLLVGFPLPFTNIKVNNEVYFGFDNPVLDDDYYSNIRVLPTKIIDGDNNISSMNSNFKYLNDYYWYNIAIGIKVPRDRDYMRVELGLINDNNEDDISVYYNYIKIEDLYLESDDPLNTVIESPTKVTVTNKTTRLKGNTTKELSIDMMYGTFEETENDTNDMEF